MEKLTKEQIFEGNKLIAEFLGGSVDNKTFFYGKNKNYNDEIELKVYNINNAKFHSDWNWLMLVVEKIEVSSGNFVICLNTCEINAGKFDCYLIEADSKIEAVWSSAVEFIKWYNENGK